MHTVNVSFSGLKGEGKHHLKQTRNGEMRFNSKPELHSIYDYLEGDWERAISKYFLAGAVLNSMSSEPEGLLSYMSTCYGYTATTPAQKAQRCFFPREMVSHYLVTDGEGIRAHRCQLPKGQCCPHLPRELKASSRTITDRRSHGHGGSRIRSWYFFKEAWHPGGAQPTPGTWARQGGRDGLIIPRLTGRGCPACHLPGMQGGLAEPRGQSPWNPRSRADGHLN